MQTFQVDCASRRALLPIMFALLLSACSSVLQPAVGERDLYAANTPADYPDNRVFYVGKTDRATGLTAVVPSWNLGVPEQSKESPSRALVHNSPLSIIVDAVGLPVAAEQTSRDIAIILDVQAESATEMRSLVVWYQRGVNAGQTLNFKNLLIYSQEQWDERIAPMFRIRVLDVAAEKNIETRETLAQVGKFGSTLGALVKNPLAQAAVETATRAASLVLASRANKVVMDYTVQFFDARLVAAAGTPNLTPLLAGRFVLAGRSLADLKNESFWRRAATLDEYNTVVQFRDQPGGPVVALSPGISVQILDRELIVPTQVAARSAYLTKLLTDSTNASLEEIKFTASTLVAEVNTLNLREQILRYRQIASITEMVSSMFMSDPSTKKYAMPDSTRQAIARFLRKISGCSAIESESIQKWWDNVKPTTVFKTADESAKSEASKMDVILMRTSGDLCASS